MDILDFFDNPSNLKIIKKDPFADDAEFLESLKRDYLENASSS